jgi:hypothetical protein
MKETLLAMLMLTSWAQDKGDEEHLVELPTIPRLTAVRGDIDGKPITVKIEMMVQPGVRVMNLKTAVLARENFDHLVFGAMRPEEGRWNHLEELLFVTIETAARNHKLTNSERAKLRLAGRGDIKRFFDRVEDERNDFELHRVGFENGLAALRRLRPLSDTFNQGPFDDGSLFVKTLRKINKDKAADNQHPTSTRGGRQIRYAV